MDRKRLDSLIVRVQSSCDEQAFSEFYEETQNGLFAYLLSVLKKREAAEDVMQDTYIKFRQNVQSYKAGTNAFAYLVQIGKNIAFNRLRREKYETAVDYGEWELSDNGESVENAADTTVTDAIKQLPPTEAQIVTLHIVAGFKHREIADMLDMPIGTVMWSYNNSIKKLKIILKEALK